MRPVVIFIDGQDLVGWTEMTLTRSKEKMTGELSVSIFFGYMPTEPIVVDACRGREITVYVGGHLAFIGSIDKRKGTSDRAGEPGTDANEPTAAPTGTSEMSSSMSYSIGPSEYTIKLTARGKTKYLIDSSHQHPTTNMVGKPHTKQVVEKLTEPWQTEIEWLGTDVELDKVRFRDGARVVDELHRVCCENCYYMYETRDGKLRVTDDTGMTQGEPIVLGTNILSFSSEQSEDQAKSKIKVKGQRTNIEYWGKEAVEKTIKTVEDQWVGADLPITVQHYGDATPEALERRATFEANKRSSASKKVQLEVFHVQSTGGAPWDIGQLHYVEIPPEGIFDVFECTDLTYTANTTELKTSLTFSPPPSKVAGGGSSLPEMAGNFVGIGNSRRSAIGVSFAPGRYPSPWSGPSLLTLPFKALSSVLGFNATARQPLKNLRSRPSSQVPLTLPANYKSPGEQ